MLPNVILILKIRLLYVLIRLSNGPPKFLLFTLINLTNQSPPLKLPLYILNKQYQKGSNHLDNTESVPGAEVVLVNSGEENRSLGGAERGEKQGCGLFHEMLQRRVF